MARIPGVEEHEAGFFTRLVYSQVKRRLKRVIEPFKIAAHHKGIFRANLAMERGQLAARTVDPAIKALAQLKTAMRIGCPF